MATPEEAVQELEAKLLDRDKELEALRIKSRELLDEKKATKTGAERLLADANEKIEELNAQIKNLQTDSEKKLNALEARNKEAVGLVESERNANVKLLVENGITDALTKAGVIKELLPAARALIKEQGIVSIEADGDSRKAVVVMKADGKEERLSITDYVSKHFVASNEGKAFVSATINFGAGASGSSSNVRTSEKGVMLEKYQKAVKDGNADLALSLKEQMAAIP